MGITNHVQKTGWKDKLDDYISQHPKLQGALIGVNVCEAETGNNLFHHNASTRLHPASNMKLLTAAAALDTLGKDYVFTTEIWIDGVINNHELQGNLYIKGMGDPMLLPKDLDQFADQIYNLHGIRSISGDVVADDVWYDDVRLSPDMMWDDEHFYYGAQVSALTLSPNADFDAGTVMIEVRPGTADGEAVQVSVFPDTAYVQIENHGITVGDEAKETELKIIRRHGENTIVINGKLAVGTEPIKAWIAVWEPTKYVLQVFAEKLTSSGIQLNGRKEMGCVPKHARRLIHHTSIPLAELLIPFMKLSNNGHAEILVKEMGKQVKGEGSWEAGMDVLLTEVAKFGVDPAAVLLRDGSGLSSVTLIPPNQLTNLLFHVQSKAWFEPFYHSLPIGGQIERMVGGTLRERLADLTVHAKTGTIFGVSTLSGYMQTESGKRLIFSIMLNNLLDEEEGPEIQDQLIELLAQW
ncbi:D-alanyl-D-alanine carboxypeptidase/D-alanyl-D-alanine-endopeptidase [Neobacillus niacini]|uniref:D-alanyl-D-alanine carboxypeptidase/D-alanyl-D-alanine endopeptidase n=1 Tax=Neobacillus niacini TaxID=86668 RepID=UPI0021CB4082|nr:D-alanyl-D-alanine carboxypeptidase/D-alanyl-D-alanine-endopeptidase [Neobacillus niacini]MCM3766399.1 D-alanyl-D-alanine carboxypeptidase/D-alanyl-D-alanine-endopeptidase [Neobacillus niacini]